MKYGFMEIFLYSLPVVIQLDFYIFVWHVSLYVRDLETC